MGKRTEVTIETREVWVIHQPCPPATNHPSARAHCQLCAAWVEWLTPDEAVTVTGLSQRQLFRLIENAQVHFRETAAGGILLCRPSLAICRVPERRALAAPT